jgi:hypothetical protein
VAEPLDKWAARTARALREVPDTVRRAKRDAAKLAQKVARERAPRRTGDLRRSIEATVDARGSLHVHSDDQAAPYIEHGTRHVRPYRMIEQGAEAAADEMTDNLPDALERRVLHGR